MVNFFYLDKDPNKCAQYYCNKHVLKIPIEIAQILSKIHHELETGIDYCKIYKNSVVVKNTLGPYCWVKESYDNYVYTSKLGLALINEYKLRYNKDTHKSEPILQHLVDNPPKLPKIGITRFKRTNKYDMFQYISKDPIICARYNYAEMKCVNDKWDIHGPPDWYLETRKYILEVIAWADEHSKSNIYSFYQQKVELLCKKLNIPFIFYNSYEDFIKNKNPHNSVEDVVDFSKIEKLDPYKTPRSFRKRDMDRVKYLLNFSFINLPFNNTSYIVRIEKSVLLSFSFVYLLLF